MGDVKEFLKKSFDPSFTGDAHENWDVCCLPQSIFVLHESIMKTKCNILSLSERTFKRVEKK